MALTAGCHLISEADTTEVVGKFGYLRVVDESVCQTRPLSTTITVRRKSRSTSNRGTGRVQVSKVEVFTPQSFPVPAHRGREPSASNDAEIKHQCEPRLFSWDGKEDRTGQVSLQQVSNVPKWEPESLDKLERRLEYWTRKAAETGERSARLEAENARKAYELAKASAR